MFKPFFIRPQSSGRIKLSFFNYYFMTYEIVYFLASGRPCIEGHFDQNSESSTEDGDRQSINNYTGINQQF